MTCAKKIIRAVLVLKDGRVFNGENSCRTPQTVCPRLPGEGYAKCGTVCHQPFHAEIDVLQQAIMGGYNVEDAHMTIHNHRVCPDCAITLSHFRVTWETRT